ncbi:MAG: aminotransferase class V-fold PLP-dependent enzyme, partial [Planctomycetaceae bacterium]|nr:aminotransferase class V-fold PLP-dependent enzyme [Planctomycetaceae bacterium]
MTTNCEYASEWQLESGVIYLNHGSFGPAPVSVREACREWSSRLQRQPMKFFCREMEELLEGTAEDLAGFLNTSPARIALTDNATTAMNIVSHSVPLNAGDEVLLTDHEYGAVRNIWQEACRVSGAKLVTATLPYPLSSADETTAAVAQMFTERTRVVVVSHVTSPTAAILPVQQICRTAGRRNILSVVDGPHAIGMLDVRPDEIGCDYFCASCHKWLCAAFGSGFLWVHPRHHSSVRCPIVSWGGSIAGRAPSWKDRINWLGTRDPAPLLSVSAALTFWKRVGLNTFRSHARQLAVSARDRLLQLPGTGPFCTPGRDDFVSMFAVELPQPADWRPGYHGHPDPLQADLRDRWNIEVPVASWNKRRYLRVS